MEVYDVTCDLDFIDQAATFTEFVLANFLDETDNLFYFTAATQQALTLRTQELSVLTTG